MKLRKKGRPRLNESVKKNDDYKPHHSQKSDSLKTKKSKQNIKSESEKSLKVLKFFFFFIGNIN